MKSRTLQIAVKLLPTIGRDVELRGGSRYGHGLAAIMRDVTKRFEEIRARQRQRRPQGAYRASRRDCRVCPLKPQCSPNTPSRKIEHDVHEDARDYARSFVGTPGFDRSRRYHRVKAILQGSIGHTGIEPKAFFNTPSPMPM